MEIGFQNETLDVQTKDGLDDSLLQPLVFWDGTCLWRAPIGSTTDGLSTPKIVRLIPGYDATGDDWWSGVLHDAGYRNFLERWTANHGGMWVAANPSRKVCDDLILCAMKSQGVGFIRRNLIYFALRLFGWIAFKEDRKS